MRVKRFSSHKPRLFVSEWFCSAEYPVRELFNPVAANGATSRLWSSICRAALATFAGLCASTVFVSTATFAAAEDRSLKLFFTHTGERATITFKRDGRFDPKGLAQINRFLRDWRKNEPAKMDPRLLDLVWEVYNRSRATDYIHIVSAYRSPATNDMLRGRSRNTGVAKSSQHTLGKAMDFYIPGVKLATLRGLAMQMQIGGVGYYPTSGSPFVHLDVGNVRAWPRMSRQELAKIFPNGNTMHLPATGRALPGYEQAVADYRRRVKPNSIEMASTIGGKRPTDPSTLLTAMLPSTSSDAERALELQANPNEAVLPTAEFVDLASLIVPIPSIRPVGQPEVEIASLDPIAGLASSSRSHSTQLRGFREPIASIGLVPISASDKIHAHETGADKGLVMWALSVTGSATKLTAPVLVPRMLTSIAAASSENDAIFPTTAGAQIDTGHFQSDG